MNHNAGLSGARAGFDAPPPPRESSFQGVCMAAPFEQSPVSNGCASLEARLLSVHEALGELERRLTTVLEQESDNAAATNRPAGSVPLVEWLYANDDVAAALVARVTSMIERLAL